MIKHNGKMVPAKKDKDGKWIPIEGQELVYGKDGIQVQTATKKEEK